MRYEIVVGSTYMHSASIANRDLKKNQYCVVLQDFQQKCFLSTDQLESTAEETEAWPVANRIRKFVEGDSW